MQPRTKFTSFEALKHIILIIICSLIMFPIVWILMQSFKSYFDTIAVPPKIVFNPTLQNFKDVLSRRGFLSSFLDSLVIALSTSALALLLGVPCGYALVRLQFRGQNAFGFFLLVTRMVSPIIIIIPLNKIFQSLGLVDTYSGLIFAHAFINLALVVWMMKTFFADVPVSVEEAAKLDGCSPIGAFFWIALPLVTPGLVATTIFSFLFSWNELLLALTMTSFKVRTLPVFIISEFVGYLAVEWGPLSATAVLAVIPTLIFVILIQKHLIRGLTLGAIK